MSRPLIATEEVLASVAMSHEADDYEVTHRKVALDLAVSPSTARRHLDLLVTRGWMRKSGSRPTFWLLTDRGAAAWRDNEGS